MDGARRPSPPCSPYSGTTSFARATSQLPAAPVRSRYSDDYRLGTGRPSAALPHGGGRARARRPAGGPRRLRRRTRGRGTAFSVANLTMSGGPDPVPQTGSRGFYSGIRPWNGRRSASRSPSSGPSRSTSRARSSQPGAYQLSSVATVTERPVRGRTDPRTSETCADVERPPPGWRRAARARPLSLPVGR